MFLKVLRAKIHNVTVTQTDPDYVGSITLDEELLQASGIRPNEVVLIADYASGNRFETYVIKGEAGSGVCAVNGAAAQLVQRGGKIIVFAHAFLSPDNLESHYADVVLVDERNYITRTLRYPSSMEQAVPA